MSVFDINEEYYLDGVEQLSKTSSLIIYAEDPEFYSCYLTPKTTVYPGGMSCDRVRHHVKSSSNENIAGIVDGDFDDEVEHPNLFKIDYYSIENIALRHHKTMEALKQKIYDYLKTNFDNKFRLKISFDSNKFTVLKHDQRISRNYYQYLNRKIIDADSYINYMDIKEVVNAYGKRKKCNYQKSLPTQVGFDSLFSEEELGRILEKLCQYEAIDIPPEPIVPFT